VGRRAAIDWNDAASGLSFPRIVIAALVEILLFQGLGELATHFFLPFIPGPVIGLVLLTGFLVLRGRVNASLDELATAFSRHFGLLFVPAAVGVVMFWPHLKTHAVAIVAALVVSVVLTIAVTALVLKGLSRDSGK
jgi:holin-like protein